MPERRGGLDGFHEGQLFDSFKRGAEKDGFTLAAEESRICNINHFKLFRYFMSHRHSKTHAALCSENLAWCRG